MKHIFVVLVILQVACASKLATEVTSFKRQRPTVFSWVDLYYQPLSFENEATVTLDEASQVYLFPTGKSYVYGFTLPSGGPIEVVIHSYFIGNVINTAYFFVPNILLLDEHFRVIKTLEQHEVIIKRTSFFETPYVRYKNTFTFTVWPENQVRYVVVYTTDEQLKKLSTIRVMAYSQVILPSYVGAIPLGNRNVQIVHAPVGRLKITLYDLK